MLTPFLHQIIFPRKSHNQFGCCNQVFQFGGSTLAFRKKSSTYVMSTSRKSLFHSPSLFLFYISCFFIFIIYLYLTILKPKLLMHSWFSASDIDIQVMYLNKFKVPHCWCQSFSFSGIILLHLGKDCGRWLRFKGTVYVLFSHSSFIECTCMQMLEVYQKITVENLPQTLSIVLSDMEESYICCFMFDWCIGF